MKNLLVIAAAAIAGAIVPATPLPAHVALSPCCEEYPCPADRPFALPRSRPDLAECCSAGGDCVSVANAGWWCTQSPVLPTIFATRTGGTGSCVELGSELCAAAGVFVDGREPGGCLGLGDGRWFSDGEIHTDAARCSRAAVDVCCAAGACESY